MHIVCLVHATRYCKEQPPDSIARNKHRGASADVALFESCHQQRSVYGVHNLFCNISVGALWVPGLHLILASGGVGLPVGLALLSKYTALFVFLVTLLILLLRLWLRAEQRRRELVMLAVFVATVLATCGWFYYRNTVMFHKPFVANWDEKSGFHFDQPQGYRTLGFYLKFGSVFANAPERSRWSSFWDGYYGSMWTDPHLVMVDYRDKAADTQGSIILCLALLPSVAMVLGFLTSMKRVLLHRLFEPDLHWWP